MVGESEADEIDSSVTQSENVSLTLCTFLSLFLSLYLCISLSDSLFQGERSRTATFLGCSDTTLDIPIPGHEPSVLLPHSTKISHHCRGHKQQ